MDLHDRTVEHGELVVKDLGKGLDLALVFELHVGSFRLAGDPVSSASLL
jgi:hypothetical protein